MQTVGDMTLDELKRFIAETIDERLTRALGTFEDPDEDGDDANLTWDDIRANVEKHRPTLPPGAKSSLELLREDRDS
jgi:hypothetical protein